MQTGIHEPKSASDGGTPAAIVRAAAESGPVLQDYVPLPECLDWKAAQLYWRRRGASAFFNESVPFQATSDSRLSALAASLLLHSLQAAQQAGRLAEKIHILEIGPGCGLFARFLLDEFRRLCESANLDYYQRLVYVGVDGSDSLLSDLVRLGVFAAHPNKVVLIQGDALAPRFGMPDWFQVRFDAVFLNYLLDCLPATVLHRTPEGLEQMLVRTRIGRGADLAEFTPLSVDRLQALAAQRDEDSAAELAPLSHLFTFDFRYEPVLPSDIPYAAELLTMADPGAYILHNYGAIQCLEEVLHNLNPGGWVLLADYGDSPFDIFARAFRHQSFDQSRAIGLNFAFLREHFLRQGRCWMEPEEDSERIYARLLANAPPDETAAESGGFCKLFRDSFHRTAFEQPYALAEEARTLSRDGRLDAALVAYQRALEALPGNWPLMEEVAEFFAFTLHDYHSGLAMARRGLDWNPFAAALWCTAGDCHYYLGEMEEAESAYRRALELKANDVRARYDLTFVLERNNQLEEALRTIAEALYLDGDGAYRERLLNRQTALLERLNRRAQLRQRLLANRYGAGPTGSDRRDCHASRSPHF